MYKRYNIHSPPLNHLISMNKKGDRFERDARQYLQKNGLKPIKENFRSHFGEIDLIMRDKKTLVFIEVRARSSNQYGKASETVDRNKQRRIIKTAQCYLQKYAYKEQPPCRFDVVGVTLCERKMTFDWVKNAFDEG